MLPGDIASRLRRVRVVLLDVDGTTVDRKGQAAPDVTSAARAFLSLAQLDGHQRHVLFCTGRPLRAVDFGRPIHPEVREFWEMLPADADMAALFPQAAVCGVFGGGVAVRAPGGEDEEFLGSMAADSIARLLAWMADPESGSRAFPWQSWFDLPGVTYRFEWGGGALHVHRAEFADTLRAVDLGDIEGVRKAQAEGELEGPVVRISFDTEAATRESLYAQVHEMVGEDLFVVRGGTESVDITPRGVHKGLGVTALLRKLQEADATLESSGVLVVGDSDNDVPAMRSVKAAGGLAVAMGNAAAGSTLLDVADLSTSRVDDAPSGVALIMLSIVEALRDSS